MPKIIEHIRERLLEEAKKQIVENGYKNTTVRSVAQGCHVGVGTVYNYFSSKDRLIATFMAEDWLKMLDDLKAHPSTDAKTVLHNIYSALIGFSRRYHVLFCDKDAEKVFLTAFSQRHKQLRDQLAALILPLCEKNGDGEFLASFMAESLLTWTIAGESFDRQYAILGKLFS